MKKFKKIIILSIISLILISGVVFGIYKVFKDKNSLTISEKTWISNNKNSVYSINVPNDINVFGKNGTGVFFDFVNDLDEELDLKLNSTVYSIDNQNDSFGFSINTNYDKRDLLIYTDYYVLLNLENNSIINPSNITEGNIGILSKDLSYVSNYYKLNGTIKSYENKDTLLKDFEEKKISYVIVPMTQYKDIIIEKGYNICYFFNDAKVYYYLHLGNDETLNSIITKFYNNWINNNYEEKYNNNNYKLFIDSLKIDDAAEDKLTDKNYKFDFLVYQPYQLLSKGKLNGIVNEYLNSFKKFSDVDFTYNRVRKFDDLKYDINKEKTDLIFGIYDYSKDYKKINTNFKINYYLISNRKLKLNIDSLKAYNGEIYVLENSMLYQYLSTFNNITTKTYSKLRDVKKLIKKDKIVLVDKLYYDNYLIDNLDNVDIILENAITDSTYNFYYKNDTDVFYKLFNSYINTLNSDEIINNSLNTYFEVYEAGNRTVKLAKYIILLITVIIIGVFILIRNKKKIVLNTKVKNNDKIRYVDMLTSLKNRNYLNDKLETWNQNAVYPQAVIVMDLNNVKYLNDTFGHEEGDKQIKAAANALFKTQLENTELLRTDGNEFMVYLVGYTEKQVVSYIKKLMKELKKLPYEYGVAIGFSMINDDLKLVEDAFNEATIQMRKNKSAFEDNDE